MNSLCSPSPWWRVFASTRPTACFGLHPLLANFSTCWPILWWLQQFYCTLCNPHGLVNDIFGWSVLLERYAHLSNQRSQPSSTASSRGALKLSWFSNFLTRQENMNRATRQGHNRQSMLQALLFSVVFPHTAGHAHRGGWNDWFGQFFETSRQKSDVPAIKLWFQHFKTGLFRDLEKQQRKCSVQKHSQGSNNFDCPIEPLQSLYEICFAIRGTEKIFLNNVLRKIGKNGWFFEPIGSGREFTSLGSVFGQGCIRRRQRNSMGNASWY